MIHIYIHGNGTGKTCPQCGYDCWSVRYIEQPGGTICLCTCAVCRHYAKADARVPPQLILVERPSRSTEVQL